MDLNVCVIINKEILPEDSIHIMEFCTAAMVKDNQNEHFIYLYPVRAQYSQKHNVWLGIMGDNGSGPYFYSKYNQKYVKLLQTSVVPTITSVSDNHGNHMVSSRRLPGPQCE